jgi:hypothetical protein
MLLCYPSNGSMRTDRRTDMTKLIATFRHCAKAPKTWIFSSVGMGRRGLVSSGSGKGQVAGSCDNGNEPSGCTKCREFIKYLKFSYLLRKGTAPWSELHSLLPIFGSVGVVVKYSPPLT